MRPEVSRVMSLSQYYRHRVPHFLPCTSVRLKDCQTQSDETQLSANHHGARQIIVWSLCWYHTAGWCHWCKFFQGILELIHSSPSKHNFIWYLQQYCHDQRIPTTVPPLAEASAAPVPLSQKPGGGLHSKRECLCFQPFSGHWPCMAQGRPGSWGFKSGVWAAHTI